MKMNFPLVCALAISAICAPAFAQSADDNEYLDAARNACKSGNQEDFVHALTHSNYVSKQFFAKNIKVHDVSKKKHRTLIVPAKSYVFPIQSSDMGWILRATERNKHPKDILMHIHTESINEINVDFHHVEVGLNNEEEETFKRLGKDQSLRFVADNGCWKLIEEIRR